MKLPLSTGQVAVLLGVIEPQLAETVRRGRVCPAPRIVAGRRLWDLAQVRQAARALALHPEEVEKTLTAVADADEQEGS